MNLIIDLEQLGDSVGRHGGVEALRGRLAVFLLYEKVKASVIEAPEVTEADVQAAFESDPGLSIVPFADAHETLRLRLVELNKVDAWESWLRHERACSNIQVVEVTSSIESSTKAATCP